MPQSGPKGLGYAKYNIAKKNGVGRSDPTRRTVTYKQGLCQIGQFLQINGLDHRYVADARAGVAG